MGSKLTVGFRDAIHVPFVVVKCATVLAPGEKCSLRETDGHPICVRWRGAPEDIEPMWHGVVDPFLDANIEANSPFRLFIRKECFKDLRHDFRIEVHDRGGTETCHSVCNVF